jgi:hypothetical protein
MRWRARVPSPDPDRETNTVSHSTSHSTSPASPNEPVDLVVHVGSGKTGTSSIQQFLRKNRDRLARLGTLVPRSPGDGRHVRLGLYIKSDDALDSRLSWRRTGFSSPAEFRADFRERLSAEITESGLPRVLMSDEGVYASSEEALGRLRDLATDLARSLRLVVYLRRQDDFACSRYQQSVKTGCVLSLHDWLHDESTWLYDYAAWLDRFGQVLAPVDLVVRRFEREAFSGGSLLQDFVEAAGIDARAEDLAPVTSRNQSLDAESVEFLRLLNLHHVEEDGERPGLIDNRAVVPTLMKASAGPTLTLPDEVLDAFMARWEESNRAVATDVLGDQSGQLFRAPRKTRDTTTEQWLDPDRLPHFFELLELPEQMHAPLRRLAEREVKTP